jgi:hypothetical protein
MMLMFARHPWINFQLSSIWLYLTLGDVRSPWFEILVTRDGPCLTWDFTIGPWSWGGHSPRCRFYGMSPEDVRDLSDAEDAIEEFEESGEAAIPWSELRADVAYTFNDNPTFHIDWTCGPETSGGTT